MSLALAVDQLSKRYLIGGRQLQHRTFREALSEGALASVRKVGGALARADYRRSSKEWIWALRNVSFDVAHGEALGVIGRNGSGKSTLLKILSRITEPTEGQGRIQGRVGSLLEVGTGFHPELTGRENVYLNGAILGMRRVEIDRRFDEIVEFAEISRFLDTPVKRYSTGMYLRLAFAVAAHLEPEILLVDEVLAVGDASFQAKCLGKMSSVANQGRTVLFVSHNMQAIQSLCGRAIRLDGGRLVDVGEATAVVDRYLSGSVERRCEFSWQAGREPGNDEVKLLAVAVHDEAGDCGGLFRTSRDLFVDIHFNTKTLAPALCVGFDLLGAQHQIIFTSYQIDGPEEAWPAIELGENLLRCRIPRGFLNGGSYILSPNIHMRNMYGIAKPEPIIHFDMRLDHGVSRFWSSFDQPADHPGFVAPILDWASM